MGCKIPFCVKVGCFLILLGLALSATGPSFAVDAPVPDSSGSSFQFAFEISPILAKAGCAAAECHGSATGRGGFKLSLFAGDPLADYEAIRNELDGRRLSRSLPADSLFLKKPTRRIKHEGGRILRETDLFYQSLLRWIQDGAPFSVGAAQSLSGLQLSANERDQLVVTASFESTGGTTTRDVTNLALLESSNEQVAQVDESGGIKRLGPGEAWILARYGHLNTRMPVRKSFSDQGPSGIDLHTSNPLDLVWLNRLKQLGLNPAPSANAFTLARRLYLDLAGRPPGPYELREYMKLPENERIPATVDRLMRSPEFSEVFGLHLGDWFEVPEPGKDDRNDAATNAKLRRFFRASMEKGLSATEVTSAILTESGPDLAWKRFKDPRDRAEYVGRSTLGMSIACARCHNHPLDRWKQSEHLQFSAFFSDPRPSGDGTMMSGKFFLPGEGTPVQPTLLPLGTGKPPRNSGFEETVAWFVLEQANDQFARNFANRIFGTLIGKPLVSTPDDHRISNPAIHEPVLDLLATHFQDHKTDIRQLVRLITTSRLYAISSEPSGPDHLTGDPESQFLARREARPLSSRQFKTAVDFVLGVPSDRDPPPESPLARQLYIMNSGVLQEGLENPGNQVAALMEFESDPERQLDDLYYLTLSRPPDQEEKHTLLSALKDAKDPQEAGRDLAFALLASREFGSLR
ncbi:MAG: DUF1549 domain-containing protein [Verrucomicrobia bacterium]|nr:DUF1549 domain-containing protein [Verrucomicrobiota bacterium]